MDVNFPDIPLIRTLFSRACRVSFGFDDHQNFKLPFIRLYFDVNAWKIATAVYGQIMEHIGDASLRLSLFENGGEYLRLSFAWQQYPATFSSSPDEYSKKEYRAFLAKVFYNDSVRLYFYCTVETADGKMPVRIDKPGGFISLIYYLRVP